jgi:hypothetical protein
VIEICSREGSQEAVRAWNGEEPDLKRVKPFPELIQSMLASPGKEPFDSPDWIFQTKGNWETIPVGFRDLFFLSPGTAPAAIFEWTHLKGTNMPIKKTSKREVIEPHTGDRR